MNEFWGLYRWGLNMKFHMAIYTIALLFFKSAVNLFQGRDVVSIWTMLQMILAALAFALSEVFLFPEKGELSLGQLKARTVVWAALGNVLFLGGALFFHWFAGIPAWGTVILAVALEGGLLAMWLGLHVALKKDTENMNRSLRSFQQEAP